MQVARFDKGEIKLDATITEHGFIKANAIVTRTGVFMYKNPDGTIRRELRRPEEVLNADSLETMKLLPITNGHPPERLINADNAKRLSIGYTGESVKVEEPYIISNLIITDSEGVKAVKEKGRKELSLGYTVDLIKEDGHYNGEPYDFVQTNIRYNHLSLVDEARAGSMARIHLDSLEKFDAVEIQQEDIMSKNLKKIKIDSEEYMVEEPVSNDIDNLRSEVERLKEERMELERKLKDSYDEIERLKAERDTMKDTSLDSKKTDSKDAFNAAVRERVKVVETAKRLLDKETIAKLDAMDDIDIKKLIVKNKFPQANLDDKSEIYINGRYDGVLDVIGDSKQSIDHFMTTRANNDNIPADPDVARKKMIERNRNASQFKNGVK